MVQLTGAILQHTKAAGQFCLFFPRYKVAAACIEFVTADKRTDGLDSVPKDVISIRTFKFKSTLYAVFFPMDKMKLVMPFWMNAGVGISSRLAEDCLQNISLLQELPTTDTAQTAVIPPADTRLLQERIVDLLERAPVGPPRKKPVAPEDIYLYQTGMAAIYYVHLLLLQWRNFNTKTVMFGFPFHQTIHIFEYWGPGVKFLPLGTELEELEEYLKSEAAAGTPVQAVWTEFPSNPLLVSSDLARLCELADQYKFALVVDDTVGGFCNVDVLGEADLVITSLTKSFSGYADVMGGSAVLNPASSLYSELKALFNENYNNDLFASDVYTFLRNSEDYFQRSKILNDNASDLVEYLHSLTTDPKSTVKKVYYPTRSPTLATYNKYKRPATADFTPGYGCLFSVEFDTVEATIAFYNNLHLHHGPHLGAHRTLALPYVKALYIDELEKVKPMGLDETQIRISTGLEDSKVLVETFRYALKYADAAKAAV
jgi:cystathionine gamma-synthase